MMKTTKVSNYLLDDKTYKMLATKIWGKLNSNKQRSKFSVRASEIEQNVMQYTWCIYQLLVNHKAKHRRE